MAFTNSIFPELRLKHGLQREVVDPIIVTGNGTREVRRRINRWERFVWTYPARDLLEADRIATHKFLRSVNMGLNSFLFQDPFYPEFNSAPLGNRSGSTWFLNLPFDATTPGTHPIFNPQMGGLTFKKNGTTVSATFSGLDSNGFPYVTIAGSTSSDVITVTGPVYLTVRFDGNFTSTISTMQKSPLALSSCDVTPYSTTLGDFKLVEVYES